MLKQLVHIVTIPTCDSCASCPVHGRCCNVVAVFPRHDVAASHLASRQRVLRIMFRW
jgi:hypothetical protein